LRMVVPVRNRFVTLVGKRNNKADPYILTASEAE